MKLSPEHVARIRYGLFSDRLLYDRIEQVLPARWADPVMDWVDVHVERPVITRLLPRICVHEAVMDHCGRPEHDLCRGCDQRMPGQAARPPRRQA